MNATESIKLQKVTPEILKQIKLITYGIAETKFGNCLAAFSQDILCFLRFYNKEAPITDLKKVWSNCDFHQDDCLISSKINKLFENQTSCKIYLKGSDFELKVWEALISVKKGTTASYQQVATMIGRPKAVRAVANAIARNNIAFFIPCHRIIKKDGSVHKYRSGSHRKVMILQEEGAIK